MARSCEEVGMNKYAEFSRHKPDISNRRCLTKAVYRTQEKAELTAAHIFTKLGERQTAYRCPMCLKWHLTSKPTRDFRDDGRPMEKHYPASDWRSWENNQQREIFPGMGRR